MNLGERERMGALRILAAAILVFCASSLWAAERGASGIAPTAKAQFTASHALVIGIDNYSGGWKQLKNGVADAIAVEKALKASGFAEVTLVTDPDRDALVDALEDFVYGPGADPDARLIIWFAGHGHTIDGEGYLVPKEAPLPDGENAAGFRRDALSMRRFGEYLREIRSRHVLAIFDSCFAGTVFNVTRDFEVPAAIHQAASQPVRQLITSGRPGESVSDDGTFRRLFVAALLGEDRRAHGSDGYLTGSRLGMFLADTVSNYTEGKQNPVHGKLGVIDLDLGDFVFPRRLATDGLTAAASLELDSAPHLPSVERGGVPELRIELPDADRNNDDARYLGDKLARNLVEHLVENGVSVSSALTSRAPLTSASHSLSSKVSIRDGNAVFDVDYSAADGTVLATASVAGPTDFFVEHYKVLPETVLFALDLSPQSLRALQTAKPATRNSFAFAQFLAARRLAQARRYDEAAALLNAALETDPSFAAAHGALADLAEVSGADENDVELHLAAALNIDPDYPRLSIFAATDMGDPVPALRLASLSAGWEGIGDGLTYQRAVATDYGISLHAWRFEPKKYRLSVAHSENAFGSTAEEFRRSKSAVVAMNAGFFDLDIRSRLSPVGLLVANGSEISSFDEEKAATPLSGILYSRDDEIGILPARQFQGSEEFDMAVQSGPLVVDPGGTNGIYSNSFDRLNRSAVCIDDEGSVTLAHISGGLSLFEFGDLLATDIDDGGLGCERAINLDGGPSSQVSVAAEGQVFEAPGLWKVNNALVLLPAEAE